MDAAITAPRGQFKRNILKLALGAAVGAVLGAGAATLLGEYAPTGVFDAWRWSDLLAVVVAAMLVGGGLALLFATRSRPALAQALQTDEPVAPGEPAELRRQAALLVLAGLLLAAAPVSVLFGNPWPGALFALLMTVFGLQSWLNLRLWRDGDELIRRIVLETAALCFWICQAALFVWAAAERLSLLPGLSSWDLLTVLMGVYLVCSMVVGLRRGLG